MDHRKFSLAVGALVMLASMSAVASTLGPADRYQLIVAVGGIDAATPEGAAALAREIRRAAREVCSHGLRSGPFAAMHERQCIANSIVEAKPQVDRIVALAQRARPVGTKVAIDSRR